jgi:hypothetical protein
LWLQKRQDQNYANYSSAYAAFVAASANSGNGSRWTLETFLPHGSVWSYLRDDMIQIEPETAMEVLSTMDDVPIGCYVALEAIADQLSLIASLYY